MFAVFFKLNVAPESEMACVFLNLVIDETVLAGVMSHLVLICISVIISNLKVFS